MPAVTNLHIHLNSINLLYDFVKRLDNSVTLCIILVSITYHIPEACGCIGLRQRGDCFRSIGSAMGIRKTHSTEVYLGQTGPEYNRLAA